MCLHTGCKAFCSVRLWKYYYPYAEIWEVLDVEPALSQEKSCPSGACQRAGCGRPDTAAISGPTSRGWWGRWRVLLAPRSKRCGISVLPSSVHRLHGPFSFSLCDWGAVLWIWAPLKWAASVTALKTEGSATGAGRPWWWFCAPCFFFFLWDCKDLQAMEFQTNGSRSVVC